MPTNETDSDLYVINADSSSVLSEPQRPRLQTKDPVEARKRSAGNRIGYQVTDRQVETRPMSAGTQADRAAS